MTLLGPNFRSFTIFCSSQNDGDGSWDQRRAKTVLLKENNCNTFLMLMIFDGNKSGILPKENIPFRQSNNSFPTL